MTYNFEHFENCTCHLHVMSRHLHSCPWGRKARSHGMGWAMPFDTLLLQANLPACWLSSGRGGRSGGTCRSARQSVTQRRIQTIAAICKLVWERGRSNRPTAKEGPRKTPTPLERYIPYDPWPGASRGLSDSPEGGASRP